MFHILLQVKHHKAMFCNGQKFCIKVLDDTKKTCDSGITAVFQVTNISSRKDLHPRESENRYYGILDDILDCDFSSFKLVLFVVKWYRLRLNPNDPDRTVIEHDNGFTMVNTRSFEPVGDEPYVLPSQCEQVFYSEVPHKPGWSFVVRHEPRGRPIKYNAMEEEDIEEVEDDVDVATDDDDEDEDDVDVDDDDVDDDDDNDDDDDAEDDDDDEEDDDDDDEDDDDDDEEEDDDDDDDDEDDDDEI
jgi:hypothetical protein